MLSCIRTLVEALRSSDICKDDETKAREWLEDQEIKKPIKSELHPIINGMMRSYGFLSQAGTHPFIRSTFVSSLGKPYVFPKHPNQKNTEEPSGILEAIAGLVDILNKFAASFLEYVNENYGIDWNKEPEIKRRKDIILGTD